jgi:hypothetical protein
MSHASEVGNIADPALGNMVTLDMGTITHIPGVICGRRLKRWDLKFLGKISHLIP